VLLGLRNFLAGIEREGFLQEFAMLLALRA